MRVYKMKLNKIMPSIIFHSNVRGEKKIKESFMALAELAENKHIFSLKIKHNLCIFIASPLITELKNAECIFLKPQYGRKNSIL